MPKNKSAAAPTFTVTDSDGTEYGPYADEAEAVAAFPDYEWEAIGDAPPRADVPNLGKTFTVAPTTVPDDEPDPA